MACNCGKKKRERIERAKLEARQKPVSASAALEQFIIKTTAKPSVEVERFESREKAMASLKIRIENGEAVRLIRSTLV